MGRGFAVKKLFGTCNPFQQQSRGMPDDDEKVWRYVVMNSYRGRPSTFGISSDKRLGSPMWWPSPKQIRSNLVKSAAILRLQEQFLSCMLHSPINQQSPPFFLQSFALRLMIRSFTEVTRWQPFNDRYRIHLKLSKTLWENISELLTDQH